MTRICRVGKGAPATCPPPSLEDNPVSLQGGHASLCPTYFRCDGPMSDTNFQLFLAAALIIAAVPGPGIFYVAARTLAGGRRAGLASTAGTAIGGLVHVAAGGIGVSAIILASAQLFAALKFAGALYLVWLGIRTFRDADR